MYALKLRFFSPFFFMINISVIVLPRELDTHKLHQWSLLMQIFSLEILSNCMQYKSRSADLRNSRKSGTTVSPVKWCVRTYVKVQQNNVFWENLFMISLSSSAIKFVSHTCMHTYRHKFSKNSQTLFKTFQNQKSNYFRFEYFLFMYT